ncbi:hypothetical protein ATN83_p10209 (plasmid) [Raoultella ornithinolytica]|nr:hypothetical protein ATN83_p10209 [Raoultella ornithinolytica]
MEINCFRFAILLARLNSSVMQTIQPVPSIGLNTDLFTIVILDCCAPRQSTYNHNTYKQSNPFHCVPLRLLRRIIGYAAKPFEWNMRAKTAQEQTVIGLRDLPRTLRISSEYQRHNNDD